MPINDLVGTDIDQMFRDWGEAAEFAQVARGYDTLTGLASEAEDVTALTVIVLAERQQDETRAAAAVPVTSQRFLVRRSELPETGPVITGRLKWNGLRYEVQSQRHSPLAGMLVLECVAS